MHSKIEYYTPCNDSLPDIFLKTVENPVESVENPAKSLAKYFLLLNLYSQAMNIADSQQLVEFTGDTGLAPRRQCRYNGRSGLWAGQGN